MALTPEQEHEFKLGWQAVELGLISADCLVKSLYAWLSSSGSSLAEVVLAQSDLSDQSRDSLQQIFSSIVTRRPSEGLSTVTANVQLNEKQLDIIHNLIRAPSAQGPQDHEEATIAYVPPDDALPPDDPAALAKLDQLIEAARRSELSRFRIEKELNKGGLGVVYSGTDLQLNRQVAIKKIRQSKADSAYTREKFLLEAEVTGQLEHPGIVPIYALGTDGQHQPYYAMRLIRGQDLASAIDTFHSQHAHLPGCFDSLEFRGLLGRFLDVCYAIDYAHSRSVLHRDLKPANVMIGAHGETLVVDWGLAKVIKPRCDGAMQDQPAVHAEDVVQVRSATDLSLPGMFAGTPRYAAPEQLRGQVDLLNARTDIYGLGAILYQLLCNRPPLDGGLTIDQALKVIETNQVPPPCLVLTSVPKALDAICRCALMAQPSQRYSSARELAEDIERWLADVKVLAYRDEPTIERMGRWLRHHRSWTIAGAVSLILISLVTLLAASLINRARLDEQIARRSAQEFKDDAVTRYRVAKNAVDMLVERADRLAQIPGTADVQVSVLREAAEKYAALSESQSRDPELEIERVRAMVRLADVQELQFDHAAATETYQSATRLLQQPLGEAALEPPRNASDDQIKRAIELARTISRHGFARFNHHELTLARDHYHSAIDIFTTWSTVAGDNSWLAGNWAVTLANLGELELEDGQPERATAHLKRSLELFEDALADHNSPWSTLFGLPKVSAHEILGRALRKVGQHPSARAEFQQALVAIDQLLKNEPDNLRFRERRASLLISIAESNRAQGDWNLALKELSVAQSVTDQLFQEYPNSLIYASLQATVTLNQGLLHLEVDEIETAGDELKLAAQQFQALATSYPGIDRENLRAQALSALGRAYGQMDSMQAEAEACAQAAATMLDDHLQQYYELNKEKDWPLELARAGYISHLAQQRARAHNTESARTDFKRAIEVINQCIENKTEPLKAKSVLAHTLWHSGLLESAEGHTDEARKHLTRAIGLARELATEDATPLNQYYLALFLTECPDETLRDLPTAQRLAKSCTEAIPDNAKFTTVAQASSL